MALKEKQACLGDAHALLETKSIMSNVLPDPPLMSQLVRECARERGVRCVTAGAWVKERLAHLSWSRERFVPEFCFAFDWVTGLIAIYVRLG